MNVTNKNSIGWAIAEAAHQQGAIVGVGAQNERLLEGVQKLTDGRERFDHFIADFAEPESYAALHDDVAKRYGKLDFLVHSVGYAPKEALQGRFIDTTLEQFTISMNVSAYSMVRLCSALEDLLVDDASVIALSFIGSTRAMRTYKLMGLAKAALESSVRYLALDLGERGIRVNTLSPGPVNTISGRGVGGLGDAIRHVHDVAPLKRPYAQAEVAGAALYYLSDLSKGVTGNLHFIDSGYNTMAT